MFYWREEELNARGLATKNSLKIRFNNKVYVRVKTLPRQFYGQGLKLQEEYAAQNRDSLLIEHKNWIAIWREAFNQLDQIEPNYGARSSDLIPTSEELQVELTDGQKRAELEEEDSFTLPEWVTKAKNPQERGVAEDSNILEPNLSKQDDTITLSQPIQRGNRLGDYLELRSRLAVPLRIAKGGYWFQQRERKRAEEQAELSRVLGSNNLAEEALKDYLQSMVELLINPELRAELFPPVQDKFYLFELDNPVREVARLKTITILRRLEGELQHQARIIHFLEDAELDKFIFKNANLSGVNLSGANLSATNLSGANLSRANLSRANLSGAKLPGTNLSETNLSGTDLSGTNLSGTDLSETDLSGANLERANLERANLSRAELRGANLERAYLGQADLKGANLERVKLSKANLEKTNLRGTNLRNVTDFTAKQLKLACFWSQAIYQSDKQENQQYIEDLNKPPSLEPSIPVDFQVWEKWH